MPTFKFAGAAAAVTGAARGIGRALALDLAARGADVAIADMDETALLKVKSEIESANGRKVLAKQLDVADASQVGAFADEVQAAYPKLNLLINNAGIALLGDFDEITTAQIQRVMNVNFWGVVHGTRAFLPILEKQPLSHIVNLSSVFGIIAPPGQSAYCASKFAVRGFSESVRHELIDKRSSVRLSVVHPGGIKTDIAKNALHGEHLRETVSREVVGDDFEAIARTTPAAAAARILKGILRNEPRILIGSDAWIMDKAQRLKPKRYWRLLEAMSRGFSSATRADKH